MQTSKNKYKKTLWILKRRRRRRTRWSGSSGCYIIILLNSHACGLFCLFLKSKSAFFNNPSLTYVRIHEKEKRSLKKLLAELKYQRAAWRLEVVVNSTSEFLGNKKKVSKWVTFLKRHKFNLSWPDFNKKLTTSALDKNWWLLKKS